MIELIACYWTLAGAVVFGDHDESPWEFRLRAEAAGKVGYRGIGLKHADLVRARDQYGWQDMRAILADNGLCHLEVEALDGWWSEGATRARSDAVRDDLFEAAGELAARHIKLFGAVPRGDGADIPVLQTAFAAIAARARQVGTCAVLEPIGCSSIPDLRTALAVIGDELGRGAGVMLDAWHIVRGGIPLAEISALPPGAIGCVELDDGSAEPVGDYLTETLFSRRLCGEGAFDLTGIVAAARAAGYDGPWGVEILSEAHRKLPLEEAARRSHETTVQVFKD